MRCRVQGGFGSAFASFGSGGGGGGGGLSAAFKTVGDEADFLDVNDALDAGFRYLKLISNVTETVDRTTLPAGGIYIEADPSIAWTFAQDVEWDVIYGEQVRVHLNGGHFTYELTGAGSAFDLGGVATNGRMVFTGGGIFTNNSTANNTLLIDSDTDQYLHGYYVVNAPDQRFCFLNVNSSQVSFFYDQFKIIGGGSNCAEVFDVGSNPEGRIGMIHVEGSYSLVTSRPCIRLVGDEEGLIVDLLIFDPNQASRFVIGCTVNMCRYVNSFMPDIEFTNHGRILGGDLTGAANILMSADDMELSNCTVNMEDIVISFLSDRFVISNLRGFNNTADLEVLGRFGTVKGLRDCGGIDLTSFADQINVFDNHCGDVEATGGTKTIDIQAGAARAIVTNNYTDAAIIDSSGGSAMVDNNQEY